MSRLPGRVWGLRKARSERGWCVLQADSPEDMRSWIRAITGAVQALKTRPRVGHLLSASCSVSNEDHANAWDIYFVACVSARLARFQGEIPALSGLVCQSLEKFPLQRLKSEIQPSNRSCVSPAPL